MEQKDFDNLRDMFASDGWKFFIESTQQYHDAVVQGAADSAQTNDQWQYARGLIHQLRSILTYQDFMERAEKQIEEDAAMELFMPEDPDVDSI